jgi:hypothetical protein
VLAPPRRRFAAALTGALDALRGRQLITGELPTYRRIPSGGKLYAPSPCLAALMHDALSALDPTSPEALPEAWLALSRDERQGAQLAARDVRRGLRRFLATHEEADGSWRFYGRASGLDADAASTACAGAALLVTRSPARCVQALARFRQPGGRYATFVARDGLGYAWIAPDGRRVPGADRVVNAHVLRFLTLAGVTDPELAAWLRGDTEPSALDQGSPEHPDPLAFIHAVARAWAAGAWPDAGDLARRLVSWLLARQEASGGFGGPLSTALGVQALVDLGHDGPALERAARALLEQASTAGEWEYEPYLAQGHGSSAFTTAFALGALAACAALRGEPA